MAEPTGQKVVARNRRAYHDYHVDEKFECGIELVGTEVKSIRQAKIAFADSYGRIENDQLWLVGFRITPYDHAGLFNHDPDRRRRLLVHKKEIRRLRRRVDEKGFTLIPLRVYMKGGLVKIELGLCKGKRDYDKRDDIRKRDQNRDAEREAHERLR